MGTYQDIITVANSTAFQARVQHALDAAAIAVYNEDPSLNPHQHDVRAQYATAIFQGTAYLYGATRAVLGSSSTIATEAGSTLANNGIADTEIASAVSAVFNVLAGA